MMHKIFRNPFGYYVYDAKINKISKISTELVELLEAKNEKSLVDNNEYDNLLKQGYFSKSEMTVKNPFLEMMPDLYERNLSSMSLQITQACNYRCTYCPYTDNNGSNRNHSNKNMDIATAYKAIDFFHKHSIDTYEINIGFYGGEPLINFPLVKSIIERANEVFEGKQISYNITTNGSLLNDQMLSFFEKNNVILTISLDGPKEINDKYRKTAVGKESAFEKTIQAIENIVQNYPELRNRTSINMVLNPSEQYSLYENLYRELPIMRKLNVNVTIVNTVHMEHHENISEDFLQNLRYGIFLDRLARSKKVNIDDYANIISSYDSASLQKTKRALEGPLAQKDIYPSGPCIPGYLKFFVDVQGNILPCEKVSETSPIVKIGTIESGIDIHKSRALLEIPYLTAQKCSNCWAYRFCSTCYIFADDNEYDCCSKWLEQCDVVLNGASDEIMRYIAEEL